MMQTCFYEGWVTHRRTTPVEHGFRYQVCLALLDLDELDEAFRGRWFWSCRGPNLAWFLRADHLGDPSLPLQDEVRRLLAEAGVDTAGGPVRLLTNVRHFGYVMNPVSFFYCYAPDGIELKAVIAEVHNTPWGEEHCYVLPVDSATAGDADYWLPKEFHVSPFMPMDVRYRWQLRPPGETAEVRIENYRADRRFFTATLQLQRRPWTTKNLAWALARYPLATHRLVARIYWQALRLWWKGAKYYSHPGPGPGAALIVTLVEAASETPNSIRSHAHADMDE